MSVRDTIRAAKPTVISFPLSNGSKIWLRAMSGPTRAAYRAKSIACKDVGGVLPPEYFAAIAICEKDGAAAYDPEKPEDLQELLDHFDGHMLDEIAVKLFDISGLSKTADEEAEKK